jgi:hypothetical protein
MITHDREARTEPENRELLRLEAAGRQAARSLKGLKFSRDDAKALEVRVKQVARQIVALQSKHDLPDGQRQWVRENFRLLRTAIRGCRDLGESLRGSPGVVDEDGAHVPRACVVARDYIRAALDRFSEDSLAAFLAGFQHECELGMGEIWALKPTLQFALLERITTAHPDATGNLITSLRYIGEAQWKDVFEAASVVDRVLSRAPGCEYSRMEYESRDLYRTAISDIAKNSTRSEREVAEAALELADLARRQGDGSPPAQRRSAVGYYLLEEGREELRHKVGYVTPRLHRLREAVLRYPNGFYLIGIELATLAIVYSLLYRLDSLTPIVAGFFLLLVPATQAGVDFMNNLTGFLVGPRVLPKYDFSKGIPAEYATMVAVPSLLLNEAQVRDLVLDLEIRFLANRDPHLYFALLTDPPDADEEVDERDVLVEVCSDLIKGLNRKYGSGGKTPFYMFHRHRLFNPSEGRWMGWERKRGKLLDLNQFLRGGFDSFPVKVGDLSVLQDIRYVITLDSDTQLPRDSAARMVGTMAHPLNRAVIDPRSKMVVEGYGILQPRIGISIQSAARSRLAVIYSGQTGFDIYTRAVSDVYQDLFGEGIFTGKGIYDVDALHESLHGRFPENALLSHDLIEGSYARAGLVSDIELIDDYPSHFSAYSRRKHRWVRGDWQIMRWLLPRVPDFHGEIIANPIALISRWKIVDNLRRSLFEPATLLLLLAGWFYLPGGVRQWTGASIAMLLIPVYANLLFSLLRAPWGSASFTAWGRDLVKTVINGHIMAALGIVFLLHQSLLSLDAIGRSVLRVFVTHRSLLEWETAAESETASKRKATVDIYLEWTPVIALGIAVALWFIRRQAMPFAAPILVGWFASRWISSWLNRAPRKVNRELRTKDTEFLHECAERNLRFFSEKSCEANHYLIPDNIREDGEAADRLSPTNAGLLLNARIASVLFGQMTLADFIFQTKRTLESIDALPKHRGHLLNWYDTQSLEPLEPRFVSTVDSGNLVACLWTLKQAALSFAAEPGLKRGVTGEMVSELQSIAISSDRLADAMDFGFLYHRRKKVLSVGFDLSTGKLESSSYDLLASESRIACFVAIAKGDIPQEAWFHLGRRHTLVWGQRVLVSWTGTMFEYLMPALWMRHYRGTITQDSLESLVRVQREFASRKGVPWGISESACTTEGSCEYGYAAFGIPELAMKQPETESLVISPYSTFLALSVDPHAAIDNLRRMAEFGWSGRYGFYEAVDYARAGGEVVRSWMAHHQGMSLLAICNLLFDNPMQRYFHSEPRVLATELLLHERVPSAVVVEAEEIPAPSVASAA